MFKYVSKGIDLRDNFRKFFTKPLGQKAFAAPIPPRVSFFCGFMAISKKFLEWQARYIEYRELRWRYRFLLWRNEIFLSEVQSALQQAGYKITKTKDFFHHDDFTPKEDFLLLESYRNFGLGAAPNDYIDGYDVPRDELMELMNLTILTKNDAGRKLLVHYELIPPSSGDYLNDSSFDPYRNAQLFPTDSLNLDRESEKLRTSARQGKWGMAATDFRQHAWWYQLYEKRKSYHDIALETLDHYPGVADCGALRYMSSNDPDGYKTLLQSTGLRHRSLVNLDKLPKDEKTLYRLLAFLGRLKIGIATGNFGYLPLKYSPVIGKTKTIIQNQKYYLPSDYTFEEFEFFREVSIDRAKKNQIEDFKNSRENYRCSGATSPIEATIRKAVDRMNEKIDNVVPLKITT